MHELWNNGELVAKIYDDAQFHDVVDLVFKWKFKFFERFVREKYKRQLQLASLQLEADPDEELVDRFHDVLLGRGRSSRASTLKKMEEAVPHDYVAFWKIKPRETIESDIEIETDDEFDDEAKDEQARTPTTGSTVFPDVYQQYEDDNDYEYHIIPKSAAPYFDKLPEYHRICTINSPSAVDRSWEWAWWKRKTGKKGSYFVKKLREHSLESYGYWEILNEENCIQQNVDKNGVSIEHLNVLFMFLRHYYLKSIKSGSRHSIHERDTILLKDDPDRTILSVVYCVGDRFIPVKISAAIYIYDEHIPGDGSTSPNLSPIPVPAQLTGSASKGIAGRLTGSTAKSAKGPQFASTALYEMTWWNGKGKHECNAIAIVNQSALLDDHNLDRDKLKEKYYMRINTTTLDIDYEETEWHWFVNGHLFYSLSLFIGVFRHSVSD